MSTDKIYVAGASWCGFTTKAFEAIDNSNDSAKFEKLNCDKEHADHEMCKNVEAYPTFKKDDNTVCKMGFGSMEDVLSSCK